MKVKELIEKLKELDENTEVILSADEEGNYYNNLRNIEEGYFIEGEYYSEEWSADDCCLDKMSGNQ